MNRSWRDSIDRAPFFLRDKPEPWRKGVLCRPKAYSVPKSACFKSHERYSSPKASATGGQRIGPGTP
jgi:hypothetical protein